MKLWHGSPAYFEAFSFDYMGKNGTNEGFGVYLSTSERIARAYSTDTGYLYEVEVTLGEAINEKEKRFSYDAYAAFLRYIQEETGYLDNFGDIAYEGWDKVVREAMAATYTSEDSDVAILGGIINACGGMAEEVNRLYCSFFHVTHIVEEEPKWGFERGNHAVYVILDPSIIHIKAIHKIEPLSLAKRTTRK